MKKYIILASLAAFAAVACSKSNSTEPVTEPDYVKIEPFITRATSTNFEDGDQIGVDIDNAGESLFASNACLTYSENEQAFSGDQKWYANGSQTCTIKAFYPYDPAGFPTSFTVGADQTAGAGAYDFMAAAKADVYPQRAAVAMDFKHYLSQIRVVITNTADADVEYVAIKNLIPTAGIAVEGGEITVAPADGADVATIKAEPVVAGSEYRAIVVPQESELEIEIKVLGGNVLVTSIPTSILKQGYTYKVEAEITPDNVKVSLAGEIQQWEDGGTLGGDQITAVSFHEYLNDGYIEYDNVNYPVKQFDGVWWMCAPLAYIPEGQSVSEATNAGHIWYPYASDGTTCTADKSAAAIAEYGYLYDQVTALGLTDVSEEVLSTYTDDAIAATPAKAQGICPAGWHIPSAAECYNLVGGGNAPYGTAITTSPFWDAEAPTACGTIEKAVAAGWFSFSGSVVSGNYNKLIANSSNCAIEDFYGEHAMNYIASSTFYKKTTSSMQFWAIMSTFTKPAAGGGYPKGRLSLAYNNYTNGAQVRCVRNVETD